MSQSSGDLNKIRGTIILVVFAFATAFWAFGHVWDVVVEPLVVRWFYKSWFEDIKVIFENGGWYEIDWNNRTERALVIFCLDRCDAKILEGGAEDGSKIYALVPRNWKDTNLERLKRNVTRKDSSFGE